MEDCEVWINQRLKLSTKYGIRRIAAVLRIQQQQLVTKGHLLIRDLAQLSRRSYPIRFVSQYLPPRPEDSDTLCPAPSIRPDQRISIIFM